MHELLPFSWFEINKLNHNHDNLGTSNQQNFMTLKVRINMYMD